MIRRSSSYSKYFDESLFLEKPLLDEFLYSANLSSDHFGTEHLQSLNAARFEEIGGGVQAISVENVTVNPFNCRLMPNTLFIRKSARDLFHVLMSSPSHKAVITGSESNGKSTFQYYMLYQFLKNYKKQKGM